MLQWLMEYGVKTPDTALDYELDVVDKMNLDAQVSNSRDAYRALIQTHDQIQSEMLACQRGIRDRKREVFDNLDGSGNTARNDALLHDNQYQDLLDMLEALKAAQSVVAQQLDFVKSDMRIINSIFYHKF